MPKHNFKPKKKEKSSNTLGIIFLIAVVAIGGAIFYVSAARNQIDTGGVTLPKFAYTTDQVTQAYIASKQAGQVFQFMPCYCGCGQMAHPVPHANLRDCFYDANGEWNQHAAECSTCVDIAISVWAKLRNGDRPYDIREMIDREYSNGNYPPSTPTPMPPQ